MTKDVMQNEIETCGAKDPGFLLNRRQFLFGAGAAVTMLSMPGWMHSMGMPAELYAQVAEYPRQLVGQLSALSNGDSVAFNYPWEHPNAANFLMKLSSPAGGGIGPDNNVVAFNSFCTHQGGPLLGIFTPEAVHVSDPEAEECIGP